MMLVLRRDRRRAGGTPQPVKREGLLKPLLEASSGGLVDLLEILDDLLELFLRVGVARHVPGHLHSGSHLEVVALREVGEDVPFFVHLTSLDHRVVTEDARDRLVKRLRSIEHEEVRLVVAKPSPDHVGKQLFTQLGVLSCAMPDAKDMLAPIGRNTKGDGQDVLIEVDAVG